ncbi:MAG: hypothetical protein EA390_04185 [Balneolaceae bacterium]|nr:MAG: hypothetical protein EA390_04185 [Balneolaceae bacterium]
MEKLKFTLLLSLLLSGFPLLSSAQISLSAENMALGGGGTAYLTGYEALFVNPANLLIQEKNYSLQIALFQGGAYFDSQIAIPSSRNRFSRFTGSLQPYDVIAENRMIEDGAREEILNRNYPNDRLFSYLQSQSDLYWFGMKWTGAEKSYALALRSRVSSQYEMGRGYFSNTPVEVNNETIVDQSFHHSYQTLHELSFGYAESFTFLNGLIPRLSEFIVGIAPKIVLSGPYLDAEYLNRYRYNEDMSGWIRQTEYSQKGSGHFSDPRFNPQQNQQFTDTPQASLSDLLKPTGIGMGLDLGITYLITFGSDLSVLRREDMPTEKSLRISFSITDLGAIYHYRDAEEFSAPFLEEDAAEPGSLSDLYFQGAPNEHISFLSQFSDSPFNRVDQMSQNSFETLLPTALNAGALFQINRLKVMGDISYTLTKTRFSPNTPVAHLGVELRPLSFLPLRAGTRFAPNLPGYYSFGAGIETTYFDISAGVQLKSRSIGPTTEILGASMVGIKFYIP